MKKVLSLAILTAISTSASAAPIGTPAETAINNTASINYTVGTTPQTAIASSPDGNSTPGTSGTPTTFVVDKKIDLLVTGGATKPVVTGQLGATGTGATAADTELTFTVTNEGNSTENFSLSPSDAVTPIASGDNFNTTNCTVMVPASLPVSIPSGDTVNVTVECDIPPSSTVSPTGVVTNGEESIVDLLAEVVTPTTTGTNTADCNTNNGTTGANETCDVDIVYADGTGTATDTGGSTGGGPGDRNGKHSASGTYTINTADLTVQKEEDLTAMNIDLNNDGDFLDPGETNATGYHIPGSTVEYTITVSNAAGAATATDINLTDTVPATLTLTGAPEIVVAGAAAIPVPSGTSNSVASAPFSLDAGETAILTITATVN